MLFKMLRQPYRFFLLAAALALLMCLLPIRSDEEMREEAPLAMETPGQMPAQGVPAGADLSERTAQGCMLHRTMTYSLCGHSIQRRDPLDTRLIGLTRTALETEIKEVLPGAVVTGFSAQEVDAAVSIELPCPLHWVLKTGEDGYLHIYQNRDGESLTLVRKTDVPAQRAGESERAEFAEGRIFDDVQALEGVLESMTS